MLLPGSRCRRLELCPWRGAELDRRTKAQSEEEELAGKHKSSKHANHVKTAMAHFKGKTLISTLGIILRVAGETRELTNGYKGV